MREVRTARTSSVNSEQSYSTLHALEAEEQAGGNGDQEQREDEDADVPTGQTTTIAEEPILALDDLLKKTHTNRLANLEQIVRTSHFFTITL